MESKKRKPILAALLSIIAPGLGQVYNGQLMKGIIFFFIPLLIIQLLGLTGIQYHFYGLITLVCVGVGAYLFIIGEAFFVARKKKEIFLKSYNKWFYYFLFAIVSLGINMVIDDVHKIELIGGIKPYKMSSGSMQPTLLIDDNIIVDLKYYTDHIPQKGDIVIFKYPKDASKDWIKRIVATENDIIESKDKVICVNGMALAEPYIQHVDSNIMPKGDDPRDNFGPFTVPKNKVFVMGDNRDQSCDSRYFGFVDKNQIMGKVLYFYWSEEKSRISKEIK